MADFADQVLGFKLFPWQRWLVIHAMEHTEGTPRFRTVLVLVARQNGKTSLLSVLALYWMYVQQVGLILGTSTNLDYAKESWLKAVTLAESNRWLAPETEKPRHANGEQELKTKDGSRYKIAAANRRGGRSLTLDRLIADELREHRDWEAWSAAYPAMSAVPDAQAWALSNAGDDSSVVLNSFRAQGISGEDPDLGLFEWSAHESATLDDWDAIAQANPSLGYTLTERSINAARSQPPTVFKTEHMCIRVPNLDEAVSLQAWQDCFDEAPLDKEQGNVHLALDMSHDAHATLVAAQATPGGKIRVEVLDYWTDTKALSADLPDWIERVKPKSLGFDSSGPVAALKPLLRPIRVKVEVSGSDVAAASMGFAEQVSANQILHSNQDVLTMQLVGASKISKGDGWRFGRKGEIPVDAVYAAAIAVYLARTQKPSVGKLRYISTTE